MRFVQALVLVAVLAVVVVPESQAVRFADTPCIEAEPSRARVCPAGAVGRPYVIRLTGEGGCGPALPYQFRLLNASLPPGLWLEKNGLLHGMPAKAGTWSFWLELSDEDPPSAEWCLPKKSEREFIVTVAAPPATVGSNYAVQVSADGVGAQTWSVASGTLPQGLVLSQATGVIKGTPASTGVFPLKLSARDTRAVTATVELTIVVYPRLVIATARLAAARVGRSYRATIRARGSVRPVTFTALSGRLPVGIRLNTETGVLSGKPRNPGTYRVTIEAQDGLRRTAKQTYVFTVRSLASRRV